ncbi:alpha/beta fold hydrolase [Nocardia sp. NPDC127526]|uniref:alpha/beta fold hydrolase n=1 Tax=Nocardia sp. NPDC127526 TaxID=3345393 RepID=UPI00363CF9C8
MTSETPTIVLVHGAFADSSSWNGVIANLRARGYSVLAAANPLRGLDSDAAYVAAVLDSVDGPCVLVGHSYGGSVITVAAENRPDVTALVYIAAFIPDTGESAFQLRPVRPPAGRHRHRLAHHPRLRPAHHRRQEHPPGSPALHGRPRLGAHRRNPRLPRGFRLRAGRRHRPDRAGGHEVTPAVEPARRPGPDPRGLVRFSDSPPTYLRRNSTPRTNAACPEC